MSQEEKDDNLESKTGFTTALIAVFLAINGIMGGNADNDALLFNSKASNRWSHYQSKSIKQNVYETSLRALELDYRRISDKDTFKAAVAKEIEYFRSEIKRYDADKAEIKTKAEELEADTLKAGDLGDVYDLAEGFYQISLILAALTIIAKNRGMWYMSIIAGAIAMGITGYAYFFVA